MPLPFVAGFDLSLDPSMEPPLSEFAFFGGTGVEEAEERPLRGLVGSFLE